MNHFSKTMWIKLLFYYYIHDISYLLLYWMETRVTSTACTVDQVPCSSHISPLCSSKDLKCERLDTIRRYHNHLAFREAKLPDVYAIHRYRKERVQSPAILFFHHGDNFVGKSALFGKSQKRLRRAVCCTMSLSLSGAMSFFLLAYGTNGSVEQPVIQQNYNTHCYSFLFRTGHRNCRFATNFFPCGGKKNGDCYTLRNRRTIVFGMSSLYLCCHRLPTVWYT